MPEFVDSDFHGHGRRPPPLSGMVMAQRTLLILVGGGGAWGLKEPNTSSANRRWLAVGQAPPSVGTTEGQPPSLNRIRPPITLGCRSCHRKRERTALMARALRHGNPGAAGLQGGSLADL